MKLKQTFAVLLAAGALALTACTPRGVASSTATPTATVAPQPTEAPAASENTGTSEAADTAAEPTGDKILIADFTAAENSGVDAVASASYSTVEGTAIGCVRWRTLFKPMWAATFSPSARWRLTRWASTM